MSERVEEAHGEAGAAGIFFDAEGPVRRWQSAHQEITVLENANFGTVLLLDGLVMVTDRDAAYYHEPLVHPAMTAHPDPRRVLIVGGGDGGTATEVARYETVEQITLVEIDDQVLETARAHFPALSRGLDDPRVRIRAEDGTRYVTETDETCDVILVDGSDPVGPAAGLFGETFLRAAASRLGTEGIYVTQSEGPFYYPDTVRGLQGHLSALYPWHGIYAGTVPTYPGGLWTWSWAGVGAAPDAPVRPAPGGLSVYTDGMFPRAEALPRPVKELMP